MKKVAYFCPQVFLLLIIFTIIKGMMVYPATIHVTTTQDGVGVPGSLRSAITAANSSSEDTVIYIPACAPVFDSCAPVFDGINVEIKELERVEINLFDEGVIEGYSVVGDQLRALPLGSTLDKEKGIFYWQPGPGFVGEYRLVFIGKDNDGQITRKNIVVNIKPMHLEEL